MIHCHMHPVVRWLRRRIRQATALGLLAALVVTSLGLTVSIPLEKQAAEPYPCMHCSCGCVNAELCWRDCCCYTNKQKVAWARKNGVVPPAHVLAAVEKPSCCKRKVASCCSSKRSCCEKVSSNAEVVLTWRKPRKTGKRRSASFVLLQALRCQGLSSSWTLVPPTVMPPSVQIGDVPDGLTERVAIVQESFTGQLSPPDLPPPKNAA